MRLLYVLYLTFVSVCAQRIMKTELWFCHYRGSQTWIISHDVLIPVWFTAIPFSILFQNDGTFYHKSEQKRKIFVFRDFFLWIRIAGLCAHIRKLGFSAHEIISGITWLSRIRHRWAKCWARSLLSIVNCIREYKTKETKSPFQIIRNNILTPTRLSGNF